MSNLKDALHIPDTQAARDGRRIAIQRVGVRGVRYPLELRIGTTLAPTVAAWDLDVALPADARGTHMSRFVAWLDSLDGPLDAATLRSELAAMLERLDAAEGRIEARFPFFLRKRAPVSGLTVAHRFRWRSPLSLIFPRACARASGGCVPGSTVVRRSPISSERCNHRSTPRKLPSSSFDGRPTGCRSTTGR